MSRHRSFVATLQVDVTLVLRLCFDVVTLSYDVVKLTWSSTVMCDVVVDVVVILQHWCLLLYTRCRGDYTTLK